MNGITATSSSALHSATTHECVEPVNINLVTFSFLKLAYERHREVQGSICGPRNASYKALFRTTFQFVSNSMMPVLRSHMPPGTGLSFMKDHRSFLQKLSSTSYLQINIFQERSCIIPGTLYKVTVAKENSYPVQSVNYYGLS